MIGKWLFSAKGEISEKHTSASHQVPIRGHSVMHICLTLDSLPYSAEKSKLAIAPKKREQLEILFRTPFCASSQWQKNLFSITVINCIIGGVSNPHCKICLCQFYLKHWFSLFADAKPHWYKAVVSHHPGTKQRSVLAQLESVSALSSWCNILTLLPVHVGTPLPCVSRLQLPVDPIMQRILLSIQWLIYLLESYY